MLRMRLLFAGVFCEKLFESKGILPYSHCELLYS